MEYLHYSFGIGTEAAKDVVLNLIIHGIPSLFYKGEAFDDAGVGFKPYYTWNTFIIIIDLISSTVILSVLNLIIHGIPSLFTSIKASLVYIFSFKPYYTWNTFIIILKRYKEFIVEDCFKPYYTWNTFIINFGTPTGFSAGAVLNLIIHGIPSLSYF